MENENKIYLDCLSLEDCETARYWRNKNIETLRTPYFLTKEMQEDFYKNVICNRDSKLRYFAIRDIEKNGFFIGIGGIINIEWENGLAEISLIIAPDCTSQGYGKQAVKLLLDKAFNEMRLNNIYGECYECNKNIEFWKKIIKYYDCYNTILPNRKFFNGKYYNSLYFNISCLNNYIGRQDEE